MNKFVSLTKYDPNVITDNMLAAVRTWASDDKQFTYEHGQRFAISRAIGNLTWHPFRTRMKMPVVHRVTIRETIKKMQIPGITALAWNGVYLDSFVILGIEGNYSNGRARIYVLDHEGKAIVLCSDLWTPEPFAGW